MINSRQLYDFVTIPATMRIDGGILPARDVAQSGIKVLRGEDPAFLMEAVAERKLVKNPSLHFGRSVIDHVIRADRLSGICGGNGIRYLISEGMASNAFFCKPLPSGTIPSEWGVSSSARVADAHSLRYSQADLHCNPDDFFRGAPLELDPLRRIFFDLQMLRTFEAGDDNSTSTCQSATFNTSGTGVWEDNDFTPSSKLVSHYSMANNTGSWARYNYTLTKKAASGNYRISLAASVANYVSGGTAFGRFKLSKDSHYEYFYAIIPLSSLYSAGTIAVSVSDVVAAADSMLQHYGHPWASEEAVSATVTLEKMMGIFMLGSHTDISGINWNWTP